uniref:Protein phosphatase 1, regulatory (inhibitor) subunit 14Bb n=1 Tax=Lepisosteus oculatus TaxID=7918 RepID=W5NM54_LEPOC
MAAVTSPESSPQPRVYFQTPPGAEEAEVPVRKQGRVTVKYDRKELRKRLNLEEWIIDQLTELYDCE